MKPLIPALAFAAALSLAACAPQPVVMDGSANFDPGTCAPPYACGPMYADYVPVYFVHHPMFMYFTPYTAYYHFSYSGGRYIPSRIPNTYSAPMRPVPSSFVSSSQFRAAQQRAASTPYSYRPTTSSDGGTSYKAPASAPRPAAPAPRPAAPSVRMPSSRK
jgi:hypothetical protein